MIISVDKLVWMIIACLGRWLPRTWVAILIRVQKFSICHTPYSHGITFPISHHKLTHSCQHPGLQHSLAAPILSFTSPLLWCPASKVHITQAKLFISALSTVMSQIMTEIYSSSLFILIFYVEFKHIFMELNVFI